MRKKKIKILHVAQAAGGVDRYIRMLLKYLDKEKFENILVCSQDFNREDYDGLVDSFEQIEMNRAIGVSDLNSIKEVRRLIKKYNPDIVYAHSSKAGAIARVADIGLKNHCVSLFLMQGVEDREQIISLRICLCLSANKRMIRHNQRYSSCFISRWTKSRKKRRVEVLQRALIKTRSFHCWHHMLN